MMWLLSRAFSLGPWGVFRNVGHVFSYRIWVKKISPFKGCCCSFFWGGGREDFQSPPYTFSHNHGSVSNGCIWKVTILLEIHPVFNWTMIMGGRVTSPRMTAKLLQSVGSTKPLQLRSTRWNLGRFQRNHWKNGGHIPVKEKCNAS